MFRCHFKSFFKIYLISVKIYGLSSSVILNLRVWKQLPGKMGRFGIIWSRLFGRHLFFTNTISSGGLLGLGDMLQQGIELKREVHATGKFDWRRTGRLFLVGLSQGPPHHYFYTWLDKVLPRKTAKSVVKKILIDQIVAAPFFAITFFVGAGLLEGKSLKESYNEFKQKFPAVYLFDWCIWPPTQAINFYYVPTQYRVLYVNMITIIWDIFLSYMKHYDQPKKIDSKPQKEL